MQIVLDLVKHGVLALALLLQAVKAVAVVAAPVDNFPKFRSYPRRYTPHWPSFGCWRLLSCFCGSAGISLRNRAAWFADWLAVSWTAAERAFHAVESAGFCFRAWRRLVPNVP